MGDEFETINVKHETKKRFIKTKPYAETATSFLDYLLDLHDSTENIEDTEIKEVVD